MIIPASLDPCLTTDFSPTSHLGAMHDEEAVQWEDFTLQDSLRARDDSATLERFAPAWGELLVRAVEEPGLICDAYSRFHGYSLGNRFAALVQCEMRGLEPGPLNSFNGWRKLGYGVKEGEKALTLCMPLKGTLHREKTKDGVAPSHIEGEPNGRKPDVEEVEYIRAFVWKPNWFVLSQSVPLNENTPPVPTSAPASWDQTKALAALDIKEVSFDLLDGNALGFARRREIAVSPLAPTPFKTLFHELAHVVLGHTTENFRGEGSAGLELSDGRDLFPALVEVEAESVALLCLATLDLPGQEFCRGYIQHWAQGQDIPEKSAQRIFGAADRILCAGVGETRLRAPSADEVGLNGPLSHANYAPALPIPTIEVASLPVAEEGLPPPHSCLPLSPSPQRLVAGQMINGQGARANAAPSSNSEATQAPGPVFGESGNDGNARRTVGPDSETDAWALYGHLEGLHSELHPQRNETSASFASALRHLKGRDENTTREVQQVVKGASRDLKRAFERVKTILDGQDAGAPNSRELDQTENDEFDPFAGMAPGEIRRSSPLSVAAPPLLPLEEKGLVFR